MDETLLKAFSGLQKWQLNVILLHYMYDIPDGSNYSVKLCKRASNTPIIFILHLILKVKANFFGEVAFVHGQEAVIVDGELVAELVSPLIDLSLLFT